jgi:hypothetical protein
VAEDQKLIVSGLFYDLPPIRKVLALPLVNVYSAVNLFALSKLLDKIP